MIKENFGRIIRFNRIIIKRWKQKELAEKIGVSPNTLSRIEKGTYNTPLELIKKLSLSLNITFSINEDVHFEEQN